MVKVKIVAYSESQQVSVVQRAVSRYQTVLPDNHTFILPTAILSGPFPTGGSNYSDMLPNGIYLNSHTSILPGNKIVLRRRC